MGPKGEVRNPFLFIFLTGITFGIYGIYWQFKVATEVNQFLGTERMSAIKIMGLSFITCGLYQIYYQWVESKAILREVQAKAGQPEQVPFVVTPVTFQRVLNNVWEGIP